MLGIKQKKKSWYSQTDIVVGEAHGWKDTFVEVDLATRTVGHFIVVPAQRASGNKREGQGQEAQKAQNDGEPHRGK